MPIFDLLFILTAFLALCVAVTIIYLLIRRRMSSARRAALVLGVFLTAYLGILLTVSLASPARTAQMKERICFDDWCIEAQSLSVSPTIGAGPAAVAASGVFYIVNLKVASTAIRVNQRELAVRLVAVDEQGRIYWPSEEGQRAFDAVNGPSIPITGEVGPGQSFTTTVVYDVPQNARINLQIRHEAWPAWFVIGDDDSLLHKLPLIVLAKA